MGLGWKMPALKGHSSVGIPAHDAPTKGGYLD